MPFLCGTTDDKDAALLTPSGLRVRVQVACSFRSRLVGLLLRTELDADEGLLLVPGGSIHTIGMRFAIDIVFLSADFEVLEIASHVGPRRWVFAPRRTTSVLEVGAGMAARYGIVADGQLSPIANTSKGGSASRVIRTSSSSSQL